MKIVYYTHTAFFEVALSLVPELAERAEVHLLLEVTPSAWQTAGFDLAERRLPAGLVAGDAQLAGDFPHQVRDRWRAAASFQLVAHQQPRSIHLASWRLSRRVLTYARDELQARVLHVDDVDPSPRLALGLAPRVRGLPLVLTVHDPLPHSGETNWRKSLARRLAYPRASGFVLHSESLVDGFSERFRIAHDALTVAHLAPLEIFRAWQPEQSEPARPGQPNVLFFGRISRYKGLEVLYRAAPMVAAAVPGVTFVVAGAPVSGYVPPAAPVLPAPAAVVEHRGHVDNAMLASVFADAKIVVCPYLDATQSAVIEVARAFGKPVVASAVGGIPEYVRDGRDGLLVPAGEPEALARAIIRLLTQPQLAAQLGRTALEQPPFSWADMAQTLVGLYASIAGRPG